MAKSKEVKSKMLEDINANLKNAESVIVAEYRGLDVSGMTSLRKKSRSVGVKLRVLKNTLVKKAVCGTPFEDLKTKLSGPLIYGFSDDPVAPAKLLFDFSKDNESIIIKGGALPGSLLSVDSVNSLAAIPPKEELVGKLLGTIQAPISGFVRTLNEIPSKLVRTVSAIRDSKQSQS
ncbi:MAG: 50S ribosomal protein L10 [Betaproteobacteria bacterium TMED156]|nr:MAG: 50S ribosomal protein L10 [Betaproteobacteria bacterium TMED156]